MAPDTNTRDEARADLYEAIAAVDRLCIVAREQNYAVFQAAQYAREALNDARRSLGKALEAF